VTRPSTQFNQYINFGKRKAQVLGTLDKQHFGQRFFGILPVALERFVWLLDKILSFVVADGFDIHACGLGELANSIHNDFNNTVLKYGNCSPRTTPRKRAYLAPFSTKGKTYGLTWMREGETVSFCSNALASPNSY